MRFLHVPKTRLLVLFHLNIDTACANERACGGLSSYRQAGIASTIWKLPSPVSEVGSLLGTRQVIEGLPIRQSSNSHIIRGAVVWLAM